MSYKSACTVSHENVQHINDGCRFNICLCTINIFKIILIQYSILFYTKHLICSNAYIIAYNLYYHKMT